MSIDERSTIVVYHVYQCRGWQKLFQQQIATLFGTGIIHSCRDFRICIAGQEPLPVYSNDWTVHYHTDTEAQENHTLQYLWDHLDGDAADTDVLYLHTKGVTFIDDAPTEPDILSDAWRLAMEYFVLHSWQDCRQTLRDNDCAGMDWTQYRQHWWRINEECYSVMPRNCSGYFPGNFWWARGDYIQSLDPRYLWEFDIRDEYKDFWNSRPREEHLTRQRYLAEYWLGTGKPRIHSRTVMLDHKRCSWHEQNCLQHLINPNSLEKLSWN